MEELELRFDDEAGVYLPQVVAEENKRKANEFERIANEEQRKANEKERVENEEYRKNTMSEIEKEVDNLIDEMHANLRKISYTKQYKVRYETTEENETTFSLPEQYTETSMLEVRVNGWALTEAEYVLDIANLVIVLAKPLDIGAVVELVITKLTTAQIEDYDNLKGDQGEQGHTPIKGVDYLTPEDRELMIKQASNMEKTEYEKNTAEGESLHITDSKQDDMSIVPMANTVQEAEPSIDNPSEIKSVKGSYGVEVVNKNLLNHTSNLYLSSNNTFIEASANITSIVKVNELETFRLSGDWALVESNVVRTAFCTEFPKVGVAYTRGANLGNGTNKTSIPKGMKYFVLMFTGINYNFESIKNSFMLERGETATDFIKHQKESLNLDFPDGIELNKLGDVSDYIEYDYVEDETGYKTIDRDSVKHIGNIKEKVFTGLCKFSHVDNNYGVRYFTNPEFLPDNASYDIVSSHFKLAEAIWSIQEPYDCMKVSANNLAQFNFMAKDYTNSTNFTAKLKELYDAGTPAKLKYITTTPIETPITDETFISQLEALLNAQAYFGVTNVMTYATDSEQAPLILSTEYFKSNRIRIENLESNQGTGSGSTPVDFTEVINQMRNEMYPIGRGFIDFTDTDYSNYLGFTWERELVGMFPVGYNSADEDFNTIGKTGGEKEHLLTVEEMPSHTHIQNQHRHSASIMQASYTVGSTDVMRSATQSSKSDGGSAQYTAYETATNQNTGGDTAHNNLPPYQVVAYWKRIA